jgi:hypothetical protein
MPGAGLGGAGAVVAGRIDANRGARPMAQDDLTNQIQHLIDRVKIVETIKRLAFHMDRKDWKGYESEFADQVMRCLRSMSARLSSY